MRHCAGFGLILLLLASSIPVLNVYAQASPAKYMGTASCSSSNCHGGTAPRTGTAVRQNEYVTWLKHDRHSQAWKALTSEDAKRIAFHLDIKDPAHDQSCLNCHATYIPDQSLHGEKYVLEDGVSCESCHGAAERYLPKHTESGATHASNVKDGLKEIVPLQARAALCLSCHYGTDEKIVNHRLIGAGHPRLAFELDTFGMIQPQHWNYDADYNDRKGEYNSVRAWLVGQAEHAGEVLKALESEKRSRNGIFPELSLFTCYSCHHSLLGDQWKSREYGAHPGELRLNVASLLTLQEGLTVINPAAAKKIGAAIGSLHDDYKAGKAGAAISGLREQIAKEVLPSLLAHQFSTAEIDQLLHRMVSYATNTPIYQYEEAEQLTMGISAILVKRDPNRNLYKEQENALYAALKKPEDFVPADYTEAARQFLKRFK